MIRSQVAQISLEVACAAGVLAGCHYGRAHVNTALGVGVVCSV